MAQRSFDWIDVCTLADGAPLRLAVHRLDGGRPGPALGVSALIHGDEVTGPQVIRRVLDHLAPLDFAGSVYLLPVANPLAFEALTRTTPMAIEGGNLNRVFPGAAGGDLNDLLARALEHEFLERVTHLVDIHAGGSYPVVDYTLSLRDLDAALAFGQRVVRPVERYAGTMGQLAAAQGKPTVVVEIGGGYVRDAHYVDLGARGVLNVMKHLGMLPGRPEVPARQIVLRAHTTLRPRHGGLLYPALGLDALGAEVPDGAVLGEVVSPHTFDTLETLRAPYRRNVVLLLRPAVTRVNPGDYAVMLGDLDTAEVRQNQTRRRDDER